MNAITVNAFLADSAETVAGKIYALGIGWNAIFAEKFPCVHPRMSLGIIINVPYTSINQNHKLSVSLQTEDGARVPVQRQLNHEGELVLLDNIDVDFNVGRPPHLPAGDSQIIPFSLTFDQMTFDRPGMYTWVAEVDGSEMTRVAMRLGQINRPMNQ